MGNNSNPPIASVPLYTHVNRDAYGNPNSESTWFQQEYGTVLL